MYIATLNQQDPGNDPLTIRLAADSFTYAAYFIVLAMFFDAIDGRLARLTRHTTDFGGQLDSLADVISFGAAPALIALQVFKQFGPPLPDSLSRIVWCLGAVYLACAALRLARFNVSNEHGEQHHFSFLGLPSPAAGGLIASLILLHQSLLPAEPHSPLWWLSQSIVVLLPAALLGAGLLMVSHIRYPHFVNQYLRGKRSLARLLFLFSIVLLTIVAHKFMLAAAFTAFALMGPLSTAYTRLRRPSHPERQ
jgi:CDP-diacylglycerol--serine O-phosphatidyltransferase